MNPDRRSILKSPAAVSASVAYTGTAGSIQQAIRGNCMRVWCTTDAYVNMGAVATAGNGTPLQAYETLWLPIPDNSGTGQGFNIGSTPTILVSAIQISAGGTLYAQQFSE
jgi:hypothetical protein